MSDDFFQRSFPRTGISPPRDRDSARRKAMNHFAVAEKRDNQARQEIARLREAGDAKTAKLRALRLAKEEEDRLAAAALPPAVPVKKRAKPPAL